MSRSFQHSRQASILVVATSLVTLLALPIHAIDDNLTKGATNNHVFEAGMWGENIDNLNGGLNLTIPLGPEFRVSPDVSYQLQLTYSSKIWEMTGANLNQRMDSRLTAHGQAGLGFTLQLGRRYKHAASPDCEAYEEVFEDQTGAAHPLDMLPSPDGSYLMTVGSNKIRRPDGTMLALGQVVQDKRPSAQWPECKDPANEPEVDVHTNGYRGEYVTQIAGKDVDPNSQAPVNWVNIAYATEAGRHHLMSGITDSQGRSVGFGNATIGGVGVVQTVTLPAFGGDPNGATYVFAYEQATIHDLFIETVGNEVYDANYPVPAHNIVLLRSITFPHGYQMLFEYSDPNERGGDNFGLLEARVLPTGARIEYDYELYSFQHSRCTAKMGAGGCVSAPPPGGIPRVIDEDDCEVTSSSMSFQGNCITSDYPGTVALREKRVIVDPNQEAYTWTWERRPYTSVVVDGSRKPLSNPWKVVMKDPYGNDTATYYWAQVGSRDPNIPAMDDNEPFWRNGLVGGVQYFRGPSTVPLNLVRTELQIWEDRLESYAPYHQGHYKRIKEKRTVHHDNGGQTSRTVHEDWDGYGHYRTATEYGFEGLPYRIARTGYNCDTLFEGACVARATHVDPNVWVLDTYSFKETLDPNGQVLQRSEYLFDDFGYLKIQKDLLTIPQTLSWSMTPGNTASGAPEDIITEYCYEGDANCPGTPVAERTGNLQSKGIMPFGSSSPAYLELYTYEHGPYLKTKQINGVAWKSEDKDIDAATGLTAVSRDASGLQTTFDYDLLGRLTMVNPVSMNGVEQPVVLSYPDIHTTELMQAADPNDFIHSKFSFDELGRLARVEKRQSDGSVGAQITRYNEAGRMVFQSEWFDPNQLVDPNVPPGTTFDYTDPMSDPNAPAEDPFGRVRKTVTADLKVTRTDYAGLSSTVVVEGVEGACGGDIKASTFYERDAFGRLAQVISARGASVGDCSPTARRDGADAQYTYDPLDRMTRVRLEGEDPNGTVVSQYRYYTYDALGRRLTETNPENGTVTYLAHDILGNVLQKEDAAGRVFTYDYDAASRLTNVSNFPSPIMTITYDEAGRGYAAGKLTTVTSYDDAGQALIKEERRYNGLNGRLSERKWRVRGWDPAKTFLQQPWIVMGYQHDALGLLSGITYPEDPNVARQVGHPLYHYANGHLTSVSDANRGAMVEEVEYNPAGGVQSITTRGEVTTVIEPDERNRPTSIMVVGPSSCGDGTCNYGEACVDCPADCGECEDPPGGDCEIGEICNISWIPSARRPIGQVQMVTLFNSGAYEYDGAGNIARIGSDHYRYDTLNRLIMASIVTPTANIENLTWSYDDFGNMLSQHREDAGSSSWSIHHDFAVTPERNQIEQYWVDGVAREASYDDTGSMTSDGDREYIYDVLGRMLEVYESDGTGPGPFVARYAYDHEGYRLTKYDADGTTTFYLRDLDGRVLSEFRRPADPLAKPFWSKDYVYAAGRHVAMVENDRPAAPGGIDVQTNQYGQSPAFVTLSWEAVADLDLLQYRIYRKDAAGNEQAFVHQNLASTIWTDSDPNIQGQTFTYRLTAVDQAANESERSEPVVVTPGDGIFPGAPILMAPKSGNRWVRLKWSKPSTPDVWSFRLYRRLSGGQWAQIGEEFRVLEVTDRTVANGVTYNYQVRAVDTAGLVSPPSNEQSASPDDGAPPSAPQGLVAVAGTTQVDLLWQPSASQDATGQYRVYRSVGHITDPNATAHAVIVGTTLVDSANVEPNTPYYYRVRALDYDGNLSAFSTELLVHTKDPSVGIPQFTNQSWDYCGGGPFSCCLPQNFATCGGEDFEGNPIPAQTTHRNFVLTRAQWTQPPAQLEQMRVYRRRSPAEPFELAGLLPPPGESAFPLLGASDWRYGQFSFNPADACVPWEYRVSAVNTSGGESALSSPQVVSYSMLRPENLSVPAEQLPRDPLGNVMTDLPPMEAVEMHGLTLQWSSVNTSCPPGFSGYHVYRQRRKAGFDYYVDPNAPPIRLTREPIGYPQFRVQYLSHLNETSLPHPIFAGLFGTRYNNNETIYAVTSVDALGHESASSSGVTVNTDNEESTRHETFGSGPQNYDSPWGLPLLPPDPNFNGVIPAIDPNQIDWQWHYGQNAQFQIGPKAGNWVLFTWGDTGHEVAGYPNEFRIWRQSGADPNYNVLDVGFIPGDDLGLRQFIWQMDPNLACEDANYRVQGVGLFSREGAWSDPPTFVAKHKLVPENPRITLDGATVNIAWDGLPECGGTLMGYKVLRSGSVASCNMMPADANFIAISNLLSASETELEGYEPPASSTRYWYRVKAYWGGTSETNASVMSAGICTSAEAGPAPPKVWGFSTLQYWDPNVWDYSTACLSGQYGECPIGLLWDPPPATVGPVVGYNVYRSNASFEQCETYPSNMPADPNAYSKVNLDPDPLLERRFQYVPHGTAAYWFRVTAVYPGGEESEMSLDGGCGSVGGLGARLLQPDRPTREKSWRLAETLRDDAPGISGRIAAGAGDGDVSGGIGAVDIDDHPTQVTALPSTPTVGYRHGVIQQAEQAEDSLILGEAQSPHRVVGQGSANPPIKMSFYHLDHLGTPRVVTDALGQPISKHKYLPFGEEYMPPPSTNSHKFTGHERDKETGLDYMLARYYSPVGTLRFASVDPGDDTYLDEPQSWNKYAYVRNNPVGASDPTGNWVETAFDVAMAGVSLTQAWNEPSLANIVGAALDVAAVAVPLVPAVGGRLIDAAQAGNKVVDAVQTANKVDNVADAGKAAGAGADAVKAGSGAPISMDEAVSQGADHVGGTGVMETTGSGTNYQFRNTTTNAAGQTETKIGRFDVNPNDPHIQTQGPHLNKETQVNGKTTQNTHTPIDPKTVREGDHP